MLERNESVICEFCEDTYFQSIGKTTNHTDKFLKLRKRSSDIRNDLLVSHLKVISSNLDIIQQEMKKNPISTSITGFGGLNPIKSKAWTVKDTYKECGMCDQFFERFSSTKTCQLCRKQVCENCGTKVIRFSTKFFPSVEQVSGVFSLKACEHCRLSISFQVRRFTFQKNLVLQRNKEMNEKHLILQNHREKSEQLLEKYFTETKLSDSAKNLKDLIEGELQCFHRLGRLLETMAARPLKESLNKTEKRFISGLERSNHLILKERTILLRTHTSLIKIKEKE